MDRELPSLSAALRELASAEPGRGEHPEPERLARYQAGELAAEESERVQDHLALCPECTAFVLALAEVPSAGPVRSSENGWRGQRTALAALLVATLGLTVWVTAQRIRIAELERPLANPPRLELSFPGSSPRSEAGEPRLSRAKAPFFILRLVPRADAGIYASWEVEVQPLTVPGAKVWRQPVAPNEELIFELLLASQAWKPGRYRARLYGVRGDIRNLEVDDTFQLE
jgi:anti-sigma factor RsiW